MTWILIAVGLAVLCVLVMVAVAGAAKKSDGSVAMPYNATPSLFTPAERSFLGVLDQALDAEHRAFGKVRIADVATLKPGLTQAARQGALNRVSGKHFDFVICRRTDLAVMCAIELNDKSHASQRARQRDDFVVRLCHVIQLPLIQVPAKSGYQIEELRNQLRQAMSPTLGAGVAAQSGPDV